VPTGVQIVGPTYEEEVVFRIAAALERVRPWFSDPAWRPPL
jgi:Asp-tRNA(Asn)/Glu-tRNA(Gln) amidotransferase A subunit family amidase